MINSIIKNGEFHNVKQRGINDVYYVSFNKDYKNRFYQQFDNKYKAAIASNYIAKIIWKDIAKVNPIPQEEYDKYYDEVIKNLSEIKI